MKCECCGEEINAVSVDTFLRNGEDTFINVPIFEHSNDVVSAELNSNWTGYELNEEEMINTIKCPLCDEFPFKNKEIQVQDIVRVVCFKDLT